MSRRLTSDEVIGEIEFELAVGAVGSDELGQAIQAVQQHQNKLRGEAFSDEKLTPKEHAALNRQLQFNEAVLAILREAAAEIRGLQLAQHNLAQLPPDVRGRPHPVNTAIAPTVASEGNADVAWPSVEQVERAMTASQLDVPLQAESMKLPLLGGVLTRFRLAAHRLSLFYTQRLAERQVEVNRVYGDALLNLLARVQAQDEELRTLRSQLPSARNGDGG